MTDAIPAGRPRGVTGAQPGPGDAQRPENPEALMAQLFGVGTPERAQLEAFQQAFPGVDPRQPDAAQKIMQQLQQAGLNLGTPPSIANARDGMIAALAAANVGDSRAELEKKSLTELMGMYSKLPPGQQRAGQLQGQPPGAAPSDGVDQPGATPRGRRPRRQRTGGVARPPRPRNQPHHGVRTRPAQRLEPAVRRHVPTASRTVVADPIARAKAEFQRVEGTAEARTARANGQLSDAQRDGLVNGYAGALRHLPREAWPRALDAVPAALRRRVEETLTPPTP